ncbi:MAG: hypothetical protein ACFFHV_19110 [Promethearchaeota archaeon]
MKIYKAYLEVLPDDPHEIFKDENLDKLHTYRYCERVYKVSHDSVKKCLGVVLEEKYGKSYDKNFLDDLQKRLGKEFKDKWNIEQKMLTETQITLDDFLRIISESNSLDSTVDEILGKENTHADAKRKEKLERYLKLLQLIKNRPKYSNINQLYKDTRNELGLSEKRARKYVDNIANAILEYSYLKDLENINQPYAHLKTTDDFITCLKDIITDESLLKFIEETTGVPLGQGYAPLMSWLQNHKEYRGFLQAVARNKDFNYKQLVSLAGLKYPAGKNDPKNLGRYEHWIDEFWILKFLRENWGCMTYFETQSKLSGVTYNGKIPDLSAVIGDGDVNKVYSKKLMLFREWLFSQQQVPFTSEMKRDIYQINIDFHHSADLELMVQKAKKNYHGKHKILVIVLTGTKSSGKDFREDLLKHDEVKNLDYKENIFVLNQKEFDEFIGLNERTKSPSGDFYLEKFDEGRRLFDKALYGGNNEVEEMQEFSDKCEAFLKQNFLEIFGEKDGSTNGWLEYLDSIGLLEEVVKDNPHPEYVERYIVEVLQKIGFIGGTSSNVS